MHMETYKILGGLHRNGLQGGDEEMEIIMPKDGDDNDINHEQ